jgi:hypothetical protein
MLLSDELGRVLSPVVKLIIICLLSVILISMINKYLKRKTSVALTMTCMFFFYILSVLFSMFDVVLDWQNVVGPNTFLGMGLAFFMSGIGNALFFWFTVDIFYNRKFDENNPFYRFLIIVIGEPIITFIALLLRITGSSLAFIFIVIHMLLSLFIYFLIARHSFELAKKVSEPAYIERFKCIGKSAVWLIGMMMLFAVDSFYTEFTLYSIMGWLCLAVAIYYMFKGYL